MSISILPGEKNVSEMSQKFFSDICIEEKKESVMQKKEKRKVSALSIVALIVSFLGLGLYGLIFEADSEIGKVQNKRNNREHRACQKHLRDKLIHPFAINNQNSKKMGWHKTAVGKLCRR